MASEKAFIGAFCRAGATSTADRIILVKAVNQTASPEGVHESAHRSRDAEIAVRAKTACIFHARPTSLTINQSKQRNISIVFLGIGKHD